MSKSSMKIGSLTPLWNQEPFILPHFRMLSKLDRNVVLMASKPLPDYHNEHGYDIAPDRTEQLLRKNFPQVEIYKSTYDGPFGAPLYNEGLKYLQDCDIVFRIDPDMLMFEKDWTFWLDFIQDHPQFDFYPVSFSKCTINYYLDFDHGLQDAQEFDILAFNPKREFEWVLNYPGQLPFMINWNNFMIHHFRGWDKPKTVTKDWPNGEYAKGAFEYYSNNGDWFHCPEEIKRQFDPDSVNSWFKRVGLDMM